MANTYDPPGMRSGAEQISTELSTFTEAMNDIKNVMSFISPTAFDDETGRSLVRLYQKEAVPSMEQTAQTISQFVTLLLTCARKFGNAIDNGNASLNE